MCKRADLKVITITIVLVLLANGRRQEKAKQEAWLLPGRLMATAIVCQETQEEVTQKSQ
jgi:hypothetical protein